MYKYIFKLDCFYICMYIKGATEFDMDIYHLKTLIIGDAIKITRVLKSLKTAFKSMQ